VIGLHFFNPVWAMPLLEIARTDSDREMRKKALFWLSLILAAAVFLFSLWVVRDLL